MNFKEELQKRTGEIEELLKAWLPEETGFQKTVLEAMNYSEMCIRDRNSRRGTCFQRSGSCFWENSLL